MSQMKSHKPRGYLYWLGILLAMLALPAWASDFSHGVLWKISKPGIASSYLFGTIHSDDARVTRLPPAVALAFANSQSFTGELDMSANSMTQTEKALLLPSGQTLKDIVGKARYQKCVKLMADYAVPASVVDRMKPWAIAVQLNMPKPVSDRFLDLILYRRAVARGMPVYALETIPEQIAVFDKLPQSQQLVLLDDAIANYENSAALIDTLIDLYLARDLAGLQAINNNQMQNGNTRLATEVEQRLIISRNLRMVRRMQSQLLEGHAFIAVGALHLPGKQGILNLLQQQGYLVKYVY
jgi:uncharacterized protein